MMSQLSAHEKISNVVFVKYKPLNCHKNMHLKILISFLTAILLVGCGDSGELSSTVHDDKLALAIPVDTELAELYQQTCMGCHANAAGKAPLTGDKVAWQARLERSGNGFDSLLTHTIEGFGGMPPLGSCADCDLDEFTALIQFMSNPAKVGMQPLPTVVATAAAATNPAINLSDTQMQRFQRSCNGCHTHGAGGAPKFGDAAAWQSRMQKGLSALVANTRTGMGLMPANGSCHDCSDDDLSAIIQYMAAETP